MRILFVLPYGPSETRVRSRMLLSELTRRHDVTLVALAWNESDRQALSDWAMRGLDVHPVAHGLRSWVGGAYRAVWQPLQHIVSTSPTLASTIRRLISEAEGAGQPFDVVHVEHLRGAAASGMLGGFGVWTVFDSVDCISALARLTWQRNPAPATRLVAWREERPTRRLERATLAAANVTTVVADRDAEALAALDHSAQIEVVPNGVECLPAPVALTSQPRVIFTGKLSYHANQAAIRWFLDDVWPLVVRGVPQARLEIAGADPPGWLLARAAEPRIEVVANPQDMCERIVAARLSVAPMTYSVGIQNKILEAMAAGIPVVATTAAQQGLGADAEGMLRTADDGQSLAAEIVRLLIDEPLARKIGQRGFAYVRANHSWQAASERFEALYAPEKAMAWIA